MVGGRAAVRRGTSEPSEKQPAWESKSLAAPLPYEGSDVNTRNRLLLTTVALLSAGCSNSSLRSSGDDPDCAPVDVSVDDLVWSAYRSPDLFDAQLPEFDVGPLEAECLEKHSSQAFDDEQAQLQMCSELLSGSSSWSACHDQADAYHNAGVILLDIANAVDGVQRFDASSGGQFLIVTLISTREIGADFWEDTIQQLRAVLPPLECSLCD